MTNPLPVLYVSSQVPVSFEPAAFLGEHGIPFVQKDVATDPEARRTLDKIKPQAELPTLDWQGTCLSHFSKDELVSFLHKQNVQFEDS